MSTVAESISQENLHLRDQLADALAQVEDLTDALEESEREARDLRCHLEGAEDAVAELEQHKDRSARLRETLPDLGDVHDAERHDGPQRFCPAAACRVYVAGNGL